MTQLPVAVGDALRAFHRIADSVPLWPGFAPARIPLVIHGTDVAYLIGHPAPPDGYAPLEPVCGRTVHGGRPTLEMNANTATEIAGHLSALAGLPEIAGSDTAGGARLLLHECFHAYQAMSGLAAAVPAGFDFLRVIAAYPENDPVNNAMAVVENRLLAAGVSGTLAAVAGFLAVRLARQRLLPAEVCAYEQYQEYNEGTPTYIELRAGRPLASLVDRLHQANIGGKWAASARFYATGGAMALTLDTLAPGWQVRLAAGGVTLQDLLLDAVGPALPPADEILAREGYPELLAAEQAREQERQVRIAGLLAELESGPGARVEVPLLSGTGVIWDPTNNLVVAPGIRLHLRLFGLMGPGLRLMAERLCLEDRTRGILLLRLPEPPVTTGNAPFRVEGAGLQGEAPAGALEELGGGAGYRIQLRLANQS